MGPLDLQIKNHEEDEEEYQALRSTGALGLEIGSGIIADKATLPLLAAGPLGWAGYGIANFGTGYFSNLAAQRLRGDDISHGEAFGAGLFQLIPFGSTAKGWKGIGGATLQGAVTATGERAVGTAIDERRLLTGEEALTSATLGGTIGAGFKGTLDTLPKLNNVLNDVLNTKRPLNEWGTRPNYLLETHKRHGNITHLSTLQNQAKNREILKRRLLDEEGSLNLGGFTPDRNNLVPRWIYDWKGTQFENTSDYLGENLPGGLTPQQQRNWYSKVTYNRVLNEVLKQGGTKVEAKQIFQEHRDNFKPYSQGGRGTVATVTELNRMFNQWAPGIQLRTESYQRNGEEYWRWRFKDKDGKQTRWDFKREQIEPIIKSYESTTFAKDHINPVVDPKRIGGGYFGADNEHNLEIIFQFLNTQKSNTFKLPAELLKEMGVPETFSEFINMKLYPQNYSEITVPQQWKEQFQKIVLADYNEATRGIQSPNKKAAIMKKLIYKHSAFFRDPVYSEGLKKLEDALGQQMIENMEKGIRNTDITPELPSWVGLLQKPPGGWKGNDPVWNSFSKDAKQRYEQMYNYRQRTIKLEPYKKPPQSGKIYDN